MRRVALSLIVVTSLTSACSGQKATCSQYPNYPVDKEGLRFDPQENDSKNAKAFAAAGAYAENACAEKRGQMGAFSCFVLAKKRFLNEQHSIDWMTPEQLNPCLVFD